MTKINNNELINNIRMLGVSMVQNANSGHPGIVLGLAPTIYTLFKDFLIINPNNPHWYNRDRFVLSAGHGSALLYSVMYFAGYPVSITDIKKFRQYGSKTAGHPEYRDIPGIEATTGPLGQGIGMGIGMAIAEKSLNKNTLIYDHHTFIICSDGDLQEGISYESMSLAGNLNLSKLIILYDSNKIQLDGVTKNAFTENIKKRVESQGFEYFEIFDGNNYDEIKTIITKAINSKILKPKFIEVHTIIGYGAKNENTNSIHGAPLSNKDFVDLKKFYGFENKDDFYVNEILRNDFINCIQKRSKSKYLYSTNNYTKFGNKIKKIIENRKKNLINYSKIINNYCKKELQSSREIVGDMFQNLFNDNIWFLGGSADLSSSTKIRGGNGIFLYPTFEGRDIWFGVREFGMASIVNGITLHGGLISYCSTFFCFSDYMKPALRLAALMQIPSIFIYSHDSIFLGEDGPTHQPVEQLSLLREIINLYTWRPCNLFEAAAAIKFSIESLFTPNCIIVSRQNFKQIGTDAGYEKYIKGAYPILDTKTPEIIILASGSEIPIAIEVQEMLKNKSIATKVISVVCFEIFDKQSNSYKQSLLNLDRKYIFVIEASKSSQWYKYINSENYFGVFNYGKSGKYNDILKHSNINPLFIYKSIITMIGE